jgi:hypothetical protein
VTREQFDRQRGEIRAVVRRESRVLAGFSVGLGLAQLAFLRWAERALTREALVAAAGSLFFAYMAGVGALLWRLQRSTRAARLACPHCRVVLNELSERVVSATGRCDGCGGLIIEAGDEAAPGLAC